MTNRPRRSERTALGTVRSMTANKALTGVTKPQTEGHILFHSKQIICSVVPSNRVPNITNSRRGMPNMNRRRHQISHKPC
jgi:hypothetical protein